jgi:hypothetical protein
VLRPGPAGKTSISSFHRSAQRIGPVFIHALIGS